MGTICQPAYSSMGTSLHVHIHRNLMPHCDLVPLTILIYWAFFQGFMGCLVQYYTLVMHLDPIAKGRCCHLTTHMGSDPFDGEITIEDLI